MTGDLDLLRALREMNLSLWETYPYAARLGGWLAADRPDWDQQFTQADPAAAALPLPQARNYALLRFCEEQHPEWTAELDELVVRYLREGARHLHEELLNTVMWYQRNVGPSGHSH